MQRTLTYLMIFLTVGLAGLLWITRPAIATTPKPSLSPAFAATLSSALAVTTTNVLTITSVTTTTVVTPTTAITAATVVTTTPPVTATAPVTMATAVTTTPPLTATAPVTTAAPVAATPVITAAAVVTTTPPVMATPLITTTPPASGCQQLVVNGNFEARIGWRLPVTRHSGAYSGDSVFEGATSLRVGLADSDANKFSFSTAYQLIRLPANVKTLTLKAVVWRASTSTASDHDFQYLIADPQHGRPRRVFFGSSNAQLWEPIVYDLTPLKGQLIRLILGTYNNGRDGKTMMYADTVSIESCQ